MSKVIAYKFLSCEIDRGTKNEPLIEQVLLDKRLVCPTEADYNVSYSIAEKEAVGDITVTGEFDFVPETAATTDDVLNALLGV